MNRIEVRALPLDQLVPAPYNPRREVKPEDRAWKKLEASIREFGLVEPLIWNEVTGRVVGGHLRLKILRHLDWTEAPVGVVHLSEAREKALNVVLNNAEAQGRYDADKLEGLLTELEALPEFPLTGFGRGHLADLRFEPLAELPAEAEPQTVEISFAMPAPRFDELKDRLDALVRECDLVSHVRRR